MFFLISINHVLLSLSLKLTKFHINCRQAAKGDIQYCIAEKKDKKPNKAHVNAEFFRQLRILLGEYYLCYAIDLNIIIKLEIYSHIRLIYVERLNKFAQK